MKKVVCFIRCCKFRISVVAFSVMLTAGSVLGGGDHAMPAITGSISVNNIDNNDRTEQVKVVVKLLDVSVADAAAVTVASTEMPGIFAEHIHYELPYDAKIIDAKNSYIVSVEVFLQQSDGSFVRKYMSTQSYPVITRGYARRIDVEVNNIR